MNSHKTYIIGFQAYLKLEKNLADNSIEAYIRDTTRFLNFYDSTDYATHLKNVDYKVLQDYIHQIAKLEISPRTIARITSSIRAFFKYLIAEDIIEKNPAELLEIPKLPRKLPVSLSVNEIDLLVDNIDVSTPHGARNKTIIEVLYGCGLRVSELTELRMSKLFLDEGMIQVIGKGDKERFVPIGSVAIKFLKIYIKDIRIHLPIKKDHEDYVFLNRRGRQLSRVMIFMMIKDLVKEAGITKNVSPHTFRHSFATHLIDGGADLRVVQDLLGHESITTTEIYLHLDKTYLRETIMQFLPRH